MNGIHKQLLATLIISVLSFLSAFSLAWPSYALKILESDQSPLGYKITSEDSNLIGSVVMLGCVLSTIISQQLSESIGRKRTIMLSGLFIALGWSLIATATSVTQILTGRFTKGLGMGMQLIICLVYVSEISQSSIRGNLPSLLIFVYNVGTLLSYTEGWFFSYDVINYLCVTVSVSTVVAICWLKETPSYLMGKGLENEAFESLKFYRGQSTLTQEITAEMIYLRNQRVNNNNKIIVNEKEIQINDESEKLSQEKENFKEIVVQQQSTWTVLCSSKSSQRALISLSILMILSASMGMLGVQAYAGQFFSRAAPNLSPHMCSIFLAIVIAIASGVSVIIMDLVPRRVLMISTCFMSAVCMGVLASLLRWSWAPEWAIPLVMVLYCVCYHFGSINVVFVQVAESFPPQLKSFASSVIMCTMFLANFALLYLFGPCILAFGLDGTFFMFSMISLLTAFMSFLLMMESRRVPLEIIQSMFERGYLYRKQIM